VRTEGGRGSNDRGKEFLAPHRERTVQVLPKLLADNAEYVLGIARAPARQGRVDRCHTAFVALVRDCARRTGHAAVRAVARFYDAYRRGAVHLPADFKPDQLMTFRVDGALPIELEQVRRYWAEAVGGRREEAGSTPGASECLVCGERGPVLPNVPFDLHRLDRGEPVALLYSTITALARKKRVEWFVADRIRLRQKVGAGDVQAESVDLEHRVRNAVGPVVSAALPPGERV
jgi:CRISPR-associated protein Csd1